MIRLENECVDCGMTCYSSCPYREVVHHCCDECESEEKLYEFEGKELCAACVLDRLEVAYDVRF